MLFFVKACEDGWAQATLTDHHLGAHKLQSSRNKVFTGETVQPAPLALSIVRGPPAKTAALQDHKGAAQQLDQASPDVAADVE